MPQRPGCNLLAMALGVLLLLGACGGNGEVMERQARAIGEPVSVFATTPADWPPLPPHNASVIANQVVEGNDTYLHSAGAAPGEDDLLLAAGSNATLYAIYGFNPGPDQLLGAQVNAVAMAGGEYWLGVSNYTRGCWEITGAFSASHVVALDSGDYQSAAGNCFVCVLVHNGNTATVNELTFTVDDTSAGNDWPWHPTRLAWLTDWYIPLPLLGSPDRVFQSSTYCDFADEVLALVNVERAGEGLDPLVFDPHLEAVGQAHSKHMGTVEFFAHENPLGMSPGDRMMAADPPDWSAWGENIAAGYPTPAEVMDGWMNSPGHRANILNEHFDYLGVGVYYVEGSTYGLYWTQSFGSFYGDPAAHDWIEPQESW